MSTTQNIKHGMPSFCGCVCLFFYSFALFAVCCSFGQEDTPPHPKNKNKNEKRKHIKQTTLKQTKYIQMVGFVSVVCCLIASFTNPHLFRKMECP